MPAHPGNRHGLHLGELINEAISQIAPYSGLILTVTCCIIALIRLYILDRFIPKIYSRNVLRDVTSTQLRSFTNHHIAAGTKILLIFLCGYPLLAIICGNKTPHTPFAKGSSVTLGDMMIVSSQIFCGMYIFELFFREKVSVISCAHHIGAIVIAQAAIAMSINFDHEKDAVYEFILCFIWGAFDVVAELWPHLAMIIYRTHNDNHRLLARIFYATAILEVVGTTTETIIVMFLFGSLWDKWSLSLKITTPFLHTLFSAAQLWGVWIFYKMGKDQQRKMQKKSEEKRPNSGDTAAGIV
ncbi:hypothetical protein ISF_09320 [Cordyceps fumosorosea ARSEF 2679]|uniref:Uncharacterized protein n=1 Tax=Cordyceps fumosorosea (strain ARSEF 2679) TaxID=1081104 RepID=A0A167KT32_CORFA|nr:hypothetical protein ISF_09320 [Cordyceps fumosorosea ARSEF 2679]OAA52156.1 hypothetical protein ISF_09320 [Cordyceps fumosorosea ARSEF 2679]